MAPATPRKVSAAVKGTNSTRSVKCAERNSLSAPYLCIVPLNVVVVPSAVKSAIEVERILLDLAARAVEDSGKSDRCARIPGVVRVGLEQRYIVLDVVGHRVDARCFDKVHAGQVCIASCMCWCAAPISNCLASTLQLSDKPNSASFVGSSRQILFALEAMHNKGLYHRDIRPDNILLDDVGRVVLIDFGFVCDDNGAVSDVSRWCASSCARGGC